MRQGFVLTQYFYESLIQFEKDPASLKDTIGEMVYSMDVDQQVHRARDTDFDKEADDDVLQRSKPRKLEGLDLAEVKLSEGDTAGATSIAQKVLAQQTDTVQSVADGARAHFIMARVDLMTGKPEQAIDDFQQTLATSKEQRLLAWSHIYLGRMLDIECKRDEAVSEYNAALAVRDGQQDTRIAAQRGVKVAYAVKGQSCDDATDAPPDAGAKMPAAGPATPKAPQ
jgi:tetratricopeptide (TPR) repeat protein